MITKSFEHALRFRAAGGPERPVCFPLVTVGLINSRGDCLYLSLLFDTGASTTTLLPDFASFLGASTWTEGVPVEVSTAGGPEPVTAYKFQAQLELFGKIIDCPIHLQPMRRNPLFQGLLGREAVFEHFGFGFWEKDRELLITASP